MVNANIGVSPTKVSQAVVAREGQPAAFKTLKIVDIQRDGETQHRVCVDQIVIEEYAELMSTGVAFPPVTVWFDGERYWLSDGFQRVAAAERAGRDEVAAEVRNGSLSESNVQLAQYLNIPESTLRRWRALVPSAGNKTRYVTRGGTQYTMNIGSIGRPGSGNVRSGKHTRDLKTELSVMKRQSPEDVRCILNIVGNWAFGTADASVCVEALARLVTRWNCRKTGYGKNYELAE